MQPGGARPHVPSKMSNLGGGCGISDNQTLEKNKRREEHAYISHNK